MKFGCALLDFREIDKQDLHKNNCLQFDHIQITRWINLVNKIKYAKQRIFLNKEEVSFWKRYHIIKIDPFAVHVQQNHFHKNGNHVLHSNFESKIRKLVLTRPVNHRHAWRRTGNLRLVTIVLNILKPNFNSSLPGWNSCHFSDDIFNWIFANKMFNILIEISLKCVRKDPIDNNPA